MTGDSDDGDPFVGKVTQKGILFGPDGRVLVTRVDDHWEPPGGTFEYGETLVGGLRRELREELGVDARAGPPVDAVYGGWLDGETGNPMVTLIYRCETTETDVELNEEHDDYEWVAPGIAAERLRETFSERGARAVQRAAALDGDPRSRPSRTRTTWSTRGNCWRNWRRPGARTGCPTPRTWRPGGRGTRRSPGGRRAAGRRASDDHRMVSPGVPRRRRICRPRRSTVLILLPSQ